MSVNEKMTAIADAIRAYGSITGKLNLDDMANKIGTVYLNGYDLGRVQGEEAGFSEGVQQGYSLGFEEGKQAEHNEFMENYQNSASMNLFFAGKGWNDNTFYPTKNMKPRHAYYMFRDTGITDIWGRLEELGLTLDFSTCTNLYHTFYGYEGTWHDVIDMSKASTSTNSFQNNSNLVEIKKLIVSKDTVFNANFSGCTALEIMPVEGTIGRNGFNVSPCKNLNKASIESIINALSDETNGLTVTLSLTAVDNAFATGGLAGSTTAEWMALEATKTNWNISLV